MNALLKVIFSKHALEQMKDRGANTEEVEIAIKSGEKYRQKKDESHSERTLILTRNGKESIIKGNK